MNLYMIYKNEKNGNIIYSQEEHKFIKIKKLKLLIGFKTLLKFYINNDNATIAVNALETLTNIRLMKYIKIQYFQKYNFYTHNPNYWAFNKKIFKHILQSKTIKTLFELLYPEYDCLFDKKENIDKLIDSIIFIPYDLYNSYGITFRKELIIFIEGLFEKFF